MGEEGRAITRFTVLAEKREKEHVMFQIGQEKVAEMMKKVQKNTA